VEGEQLMVATLANTLGLSATPVREALSRLAGEGAIEDRRGAGYFAPRLDAVDLIDLYGLSWTYLAAAMSAGPETAVSPPGIPSPAVASRFGASPNPVTRTEMLFDLIARRSRSPALRRVQGLLADRLAPVRRIEPIVLVDVDGELFRLEALSAAPSAELRDGIADYHDRRRHTAAELIGVLRSHAADVTSI
jgi:hypothetical protein